MISTGKIVSMIVSILICAVAVVIPSLLIKKRSSKIETGLLGALSYGFVAYVWQYIFFIFFSVLIMGVLKNAGVLMQLIMTFAATALTVLSLFWGIYLTNQKQRSIYRSAAVGIGFSFGKMAIELIYSNAYRLYFSVQINTGVFKADPEIKQSIITTKSATVYLDTYRCLLMFLVIFALALIMGHLYLQKNVKKMSILAGVIYEAITLLNLMIGSLLPGVAATIVQIIFLTVVGSMAGVILWHWFRSGKVEVNPVAILQEER